jgi:methylenetetrahydrofolate dehydrogenase (NADP+) / methenyltetrahydrofolate cyclohydrolase
MTASLINGTKIADDVKREAAAEVDALKAKGIHPGLAVILVGDDAASSAYVNMKAKTCEQLGIYSRKLTIPSSATTDQLVAEVVKLNEDDAIDGILIQLPLPSTSTNTPFLKAWIRPRTSTVFIHAIWGHWYWDMKRWLPVRLSE